MKCFSSRLAVVIAQSFEARCWLENGVFLVGAAPKGNASTISEWSTKLLPTKLRPMSIRCFTVLMYVLNRCWFIFLLLKKTHGLSERSGYQLAINRWHNNNMHGNNLSKQRQRFAKWINVKTSVLIRTYSRISKEHKPNFTISRFVI